MADGDLYSMFINCLIESFMETRKEEAFAEWK
jgi:hypothetical protein